MIDHFYVDNLLHSVIAENEGIHLSNQLKSLLELRSFYLSKWMSNSRLIMELPETERIKVVQNLDLSQSVLPVESSWSLMGHRNR